MTTEEPEELRSICADVFDWLSNEHTEHTELEIVTRICAALDGRHRPSGLEIQRNALAALLREIVDDVEYVARDAQPRTIALSASLINRAVALYDDFGLIEPDDYAEPPTVGNEVI